MIVRETVDARKLRIGEDDLERVSRREQLIVSRGARSIELDLRRGRVTKAFAVAVLGPSGNLRAPAAHQLDVARHSRESLGKDLEGRKDTHLAVRSSTRIRRAAVARQLAHLRKSGHSDCRLNPLG